MNALYAVIWYAHNGEHVRCGFRTEWSARDFAAAHRRIWPDQYPKVFAYFPGSPIPAACRVTWRESPR